MNGKVLLLLAVLVLFANMAFAAAPAVTVLVDYNHWYPAGTAQTISFSCSDADDPTDANVEIYYMFDSNMARVEIADLNSMSFCDDPIGTAAQACSYSWTPPTGLDGNFLLDVNVVDRTNSDDTNDTSSLVIDTNACDTLATQSDGDVTLSTVCTPSSGTWATTATTYYTKTRNRTCGDSYSTYSDTFSTTFGEFTVCYYSNDSLGNSEDVQSTIFTADSDAYDIALLTELALAGLILFTALGAIILRREQLTGPMMVGLVLAAVLLLITIYIFAVIL